MLDLSSIRGFLFDIDGVFYVGKQAIPGAAETLSFLRSHNIPCRFTTNTTTRSLETMHAELAAMG